MCKYHLRASVDGFVFLKVYSDAFRLIIEHWFDSERLHIQKYMLRKASAAISEDTSFIYRDKTALYAIKTPAHLMTVFHLFQHLRE